MRVYGGLACAQLTRFAVKRRSLYVKNAQGNTDLHALPLAAVSSHACAQAEHVAQRDLHPKLEPEIPSMSRKQVRQHDLTKPARSRLDLG